MYLCSGTDQRYQAGLTLMGLTLTGLTLTGAGINGVHVPPCPALLSFFVFLSHSKQVFSSL